MTAPTLNVLIVDDDRLGRKLLSRSLENHGFNVIECRDGREALQMLEESGPALLVLDYQMPEFNGAQICDLVRQSPDPDIAQTPIILLTAHSGEDHEIECLNAGADDFVTKPVNLAVLRARIETHLRLDALRRQLQSQKDELESWRASHEEDLDRARRTQLAILPQREPDLKNWAVAAHYQPLIQVGGDVYDYQRLTDGGMLLWVADATGHGASAALLTTLSKLLFRHAAAGHASPRRIIESVNRDLFGVFKGKSFMSTMCLRLYDDSPAVELCGAGHPPAVYLTGRGRPELIESASPPIGLQRDLPAASSNLTLAVGEGICLYTDGLLALPDVIKKSMAEELAQIFDTQATDPKEVIRSALARARQLARNGAFADDVTLVAAFRR